MSADTSDHPTDRPDPGRTPVPYKDRELRYVNDPGRHDDEDPRGMFYHPDAEDEWLIADRRLFLEVENLA